MRNRAARGWHSSATCFRPRPDAACTFLSSDCRPRELPTGNLSAKIASGCRCVFFFCPLDAVRLSLFRDKIKMGFPQREPRLNVICRKNNVGITRRMSHDEEYYAVQEFSNLRTRSARRRMGYRRSACPKYYLLVEFVVVERQRN